MKIGLHFRDTKHLFFPRWDRHDRWRISTKSRRRAFGQCGVERQVIEIVVQHADADEREGVLAAKQDALEARALNAAWLKRIGAGGVFGKHVSAHSTIRHGLLILRIECLEEKSLARLTKWQELPIVMMQQSPVTQWRTHMNCKTCNRETEHPDLCPDCDAFVHCPKCKRGCWGAMIPVRVPGLGEFNSAVDWQTCDYCMICFPVPEQCYYDELSRTNHYQLVAYTPRVPKGTIAAFEKADGSDGCDFWRRVLRAQLKAIRNSTPIPRKLKV